MPDTSKSTFHPAIWFELAIDHNAQVGYFTEVTGLTGRDRGA